MKYANFIRLAIICMVIVLLPAMVDYVNMNVTPFVSFAVGFFVGTMFSKNII